MPYLLRINQTYTSMDLYVQTTLASTTRTLCIARLVTKYAKLQETGNIWNAKGNTMLAITQGLEVHYNHMRSCINPDQPKFQLRKKTLRPSTLAGWEKRNVVGMELAQLEYTY
jgi:hypothetical protein